MFNRYMSNGQGMNLTTASVDSYMVSAVNTDHGRSTDLVEWYTNKAIAENRAALIAGSGRYTKVRVEFVPAGVRA